MQIPVNGERVILMRSISVQEIHEVSCLSPIAIRRDGGQKRCKEARTGRGILPRTRRILDGIKAPADQETRIADAKPLLITCEVLGKDGAKASITPLLPRSAGLGAMLQSSEFMPLQCIPTRTSLRRIPVSSEKVSHGRLRPTIAAARIAPFNSKTPRAQAGQGSASDAAWSRRFTYIHF